MLGELRDRQGRPTTGVRVLAVLVVLGLVGATAPLVVPPILDALATLLP